MGGKEAFEEDPYRFLYITLGDFTEDKWEPITDDVWHFDTERIYDEGDYADILKNIKRISKGRLQLNNIKDDIDFAEREAVITFEFDGEQYEWKMELLDDWVAPQFFVELKKLLNNHNTDGSLTIYDVGDQTMHVGWATEEELIELREKTSLDVKFL
jgi:hypothetical protein